MQSAKTSLYVTNVNTTQPPWDINVNFDNPVVLGAQSSKFGIALASVNCFYDFFNVSSALLNNTVDYVNATGTQKTITFPDGLWQIPQLSDHFYKTMRANGDYNTPANSSFIQITPDFTNGKVYITISGGYKLKFSSPTASNFGKLLGFTQSQELLADGIYYGDKIANITNDINKLYITCNIVKAGSSLYNNNTSASIIYSVPLQEGPQFSIFSRPVEKTYIPCENIFSSIRLQVVDDLGRPVYLQSPIYYTLEFVELQ